MHPLYCFLIVFCLGQVNAFGQYDMRSFSSVEGLSTGTITAIIQDNYGFIWIGTRNGLSRYDGHDVKRYTQHNSSLSGDDISSILIDSKDRMWVGTTDKGLNLYLGDQDTFANYTHISSDTLSISSDEIRAIHEDVFGHLWVGTKRGLNLFNEADGTFRSYWMPSDDPLSKDHNIIQAIASDSLGNLWVGTFGGGLRQLDREHNRFGDWIGREENTATRIYALTSYAPDELLIATRAQGLLAFDPQSQQFHSIPINTDKNSGNMFIRTMLVDKGNELWLGTDGVGVDGNGLYKLTKENGTWQPGIIFNNQYPLNPVLSNAVYSLFIDRDENLWIGSAWRGLKVLENRNEEIKYLYGDITNEQPTLIWSIYQSGSSLWLGTDGRGLNGYDLQTLAIRRYNPNERENGQFDGEYVLAIREKGDGTLWMCTYLNGLLLFDPHKGQLKQYIHDAADVTTIAHNSVQDILQIGANEYWVATRGGGLNHFNEATGTFKAFIHDVDDTTSISNNNVVALAKGEGHKVWIATYGGGVNLFDPDSQTFLRFQHSKNDAHSLSSDKVTCIYKDTMGFLWVGTSGKGINRLNTKTFEVERFEGSYDFSDQIVCGILEDKQQNLWISTKEGIYKYAADESRFYKHPDLIGEYHFGAAFKNEAENLLYFGGLDGVVYFDPSKLDMIRPDLDVRFTGFKLFNKPAAYGSNHILDQQLLVEDTITLDYDQTVITFEFAAMNLPFSRDCRYLIKMENFDKEWRDNGTNRTATYTNLSPGTYTFKVKSVLHDDAVSGQEASMVLQICHPFWATWWAYLFYFVVLLIVFYGYHRYSVYWQQMKSQLELEQLSREKETEIHEIKVRFFTNISHEIRTPVTLILGALNRLLDVGITDKAQLSAIQNIRKNGSHLFNLVTELLDFRKLESGEVKLKMAKGNLLKFSKEIFLSFSEQALRNGIDYTFHAENEDLYLWYDRDEMEKVLYNIISNAFKYTDAGGVIDVSVTVKDQYAYIAVKDTGRGIPSEQLGEIFKRFYQSDQHFMSSKDDQGFGLGLAIAYDIVRLHGGEILAESELDVGTVFSIKLQIGKDHIPLDYVIDNFQDSENMSHYTSDGKEQLGDPVHFNFPEQQDMTILIAEDNEGIRAYLYDLLNPHFKILLAKNGQEALELTLAHLPDLVVSDVMMPEMDGITFTSMVKNDPRTSHIPVIILTARTSLIYKKEGLDVGVDDYISKPFSETLLKTRIRNLLHSRSLLRAKYQTDLLIQPSELAMRSPDQEFLLKVSKLIETNMSKEELSTDFLCKEMGMSQSNIYKKLKALTGMSIVEFVRDFRLKQAAQLIVRQKLSVAEACFKVGFNDRRYFSQVFKSKYGVTPSQYAKQEMN